MFRLTAAELDEARAAISKHGFHGFLPTSQEWIIIDQNWDEFRTNLESIDLDVYQGYTPLQTFSIKKKNSIRALTYLHAQDVILYTALVLILRDSIEVARLPESSKNSFSYRARVGEHGSLYRSRGAYEKYRKRTDQRLNLAKTKFVATIDIVDFFPRVYQHRVRSAVEAASRTPRERGAVRVLDKMISHLSKGGISYGIPTGPYASRNLAEALLIDVDAALSNKKIDFVRWLDDITVFAKSEEDALEAVYYISWWLHSHHGLSINQSKTKVYSKSNFLVDIWKSYDDEHKEFRDLVRHIRDAVDYDEDPMLDDDDLEYEAVERMFNMALEIDSEPKYGLIRFVLERVIQQETFDALARTRLLRAAMSNVWNLLPVFDALAKAIVASSELSDAAITKFCRDMLNRLAQMTSFQPGQVVSWICWIAHERVLTALSHQLRLLAEASPDDCVVHEALTALGRVGSRADILNLKDRRAALPDTNLAALVYATRKLGKDERDHWRKHPPMPDPLAKLVFQSTKDT